MEQGGGAGRGAGPLGPRRGGAGAPPRGGPFGGPPPAAGGGPPPRGGGAGELGPFFCGWGGGGGGKERGTRYLCGCSSAGVALVLVSARRNGWRGQQDGRRAGMDGVSPGAPGPGWRWRAALRDVCDLEKSRMSRGGVGWASWLEGGLRGDAFPPLRGLFGGRLLVSGGGEGGGSNNTGGGAGRLDPRPVFPVAFTRLARLLLVLVELNGAPDRLLVAPLARPNRKLPAFDPSAASLARGDPGQASAAVPACSFRRTAFAFPLRCPP